MVRAEGHPEDQLDAEASRGDSGSSGHFLRPRLGRAAVARAANGVRNARGDRAQKLAGKSVLRRVLR